MIRNPEELRARLLAERDAGYRAFQARLTPGVPPERMLGVRQPALRRLARELAGSPAAAVFLAALPHAFYEENNLHGYLLNRERDYSRCVAELERFLPFVDNWATCDLLRPAAFRRRPGALPEQLRAWIGSGQTYTVRFGLEMLMTFYLGEGFAPWVLPLAASVRSEEYYINMMTAWFFATALALQPEAALPYLMQRRLPPWVHHKTIRKAIESRRIPAEQKALLRTLQ